MEAGGQKWTGLTDARLIKEASGQGLGVVVGVGEAISLGRGDGLD